MPIRRIEFTEREKRGFGRRVENGCVERFLEVAAVVAVQDGYGRVVDLPSYSQVCFILNFCRDNQIVSRRFILIFF
jgi:hypothetical protein